MTSSSDDYRWDVFISHASEDKLAVAMPLAEQLQSAGVKVWLDAHELTLGDSLSARIDEGLGHSRFGIVILSEAFFAKDWPKRELGALVALESQDQRMLLPVLHGINHEQVARYSPLLADRLSTSTERGIQHVAIDIANVISRSQQTTDDEATPPHPNLDHHLLRPADLVGSMVGPYRLREHLGSGGSGVVFRASQKDLGDRLAIKIFYPLAPGYAHFNELFDQGFGALSRLRHPNIVSTKDFGRVDISGSRASYLVMDFVPGETLDRWNLRHATRPEALDLRLRVAKELAAAMVSAHETVYTDNVGFQVRGVLHGDLKPANVIVTRDDVPIILDFLLVDLQRLLDPRVMPTSRPGDRLTAAFGTPGFMAPEQAEQGIVTVSSDIYGLGVTLCHLFLSNGVCPDHAVKSNTELPGFVRALLTEMTATEPAMRPAAMSEVVRRLDSRPKGRWFQRWNPFSQAC